MISIVIEFELSWFAMLATLALLPPAAKEGRSYEDYMLLFTTCDVCNGLCG